MGYKFSIDQFDVPQERRRALDAYRTKRGHWLAWLVGLQSVEHGTYTYSLTLLEITDGKDPICLVRISKDFDAWEVTKIQ